MFSACGACEYCLSGQETICRNGRSTGYSMPGGYAELMVAPAFSSAGCRRTPISLPWRPSSRRGHHLSRIEACRSPARPMGNRAGRRRSRPYRHSICRRHGLARGRRRCRRCQAPPRPAPRRGGGGERYPRRPGGRGQDADRRHTWGYRHHRLAAGLRAGGRPATGRGHLRLYRPSRRHEGLDPQLDRSLGRHRAHRARLQCPARGPTLPRPSPSRPMAW